jgi:hypothetical protein
MTPQCCWSASARRCWSACWAPRAGLRCRRLVGRSRRRWPARARARCTCTWWRARGPAPTAPRRTWCWWRTAWCAAAALARSRLRSLALTPPPPPREQEEAEVLLCALLLAGGRAACVATAAPALAAALRDVLVQEGHVGTARPAICDAPGLPPLSRATFTAATFAARGGPEAGVAARRAAWAEFVEHMLARHGGVQQLLPFARAPLQLPPSGACTPAVAALSLDAAASAQFEKFKGPGAFTAMLQDWAHDAWASVAVKAPNEWAGGIGCHAGADPLALGADAVTPADVAAGAKAPAAAPRSDDGHELEGELLVRPMSVLDCWRWLLGWMWAEKRGDLIWCAPARAHALARAPDAPRSARSPQCRAPYRCVIAILWNCIWTLYAPVILTCARGVRTSRHAGVVALGVLSAAAAALRATVTSSTRRHSSWPTTAPAHPTACLRRPATAGCCARPRVARPDSCRALHAVCALTCCRLCCGALALALNAARTTPSTITRATSSSWWASLSMGRS